MFKIRRFRSVTLLVAGCTLAAVLSAQEKAVPLKNWAAPLYWQPSQSEAEIAKATGHPAAQLDSAGTIRPEAQTPANSLVFVGMTPCRVVDTRAGSSFPGAFGAPSLVAASNRNFPIQSSTTCSIPSNALAYSFNVTVVPPAFLGYITIYPTGQAQPLASTLNDYLGTVVANAAIVPAGSPTGSVTVYASHATDLIIDINGYYAQQSGITLAQGSAGAPALSFNGDVGTGIFSSGTGVLNFSTGGTNRLTVRSDGDLDMSGNLRQGGTTLMQTNGTNGLALGTNAMPGNIGVDNEAIGTFALQTLTTGNTNTAVGSGALRATNSSANTAVGTYAMRFGTGGSNTVIGAYAARQKITGDANIYVGVGVADSAANIESNTIRLGDPSTQNRAFVAGIRGVTTGSSDAVGVVIDSNGQLGTINSSRRFKEDIQDMGQVSEDLMRLRPVTYRYKQAYADGEKPLDYGLIAEEVAEVYPDLVVKSRDGQIETVQYQKLTPMLLNEVQRQNAKIRGLEERLAQMQSLLERLTTQTGSK